jgi:hypothetical protein
MAMVIRPLDPRILTVLITLPLQNNNTRKKNLIKKKKKPQSSGAEEVNLKTNKKMKPETPTTTHKKLNS